LPGLRVRFQWNRHYAKGIDSGIIDFVIVGDIDNKFLQQLIDKAENKIETKIRSLILNRDEFKKLRKKIDIGRALVVWNSRLDLKQM